MRHALRLYLGKGRDGERPPLATILFWLGCLLPLVARIRPLEDLVTPLWLMAVMLGALLALWPQLDWLPAGGRWRFMVLFTVAAIGYAFVDGSGNSVTLLLVVLANVVITLGVWPGVAASAALALAMLVTIPALYGLSWEDTLRQTVGTAVMALGTVAVAQLISSEQRRRLEAGGLLKELRTAHVELQEAHEQLEAAHLHLQNRADQARELTVAEERARLAREVHDAVGHHLTVVKLDLTNALRLHERGNEAAWDEVAAARVSATRALDEVRRAVRAMGPGPLADATLGTALADLAGSFDGTGLATSFEVTGPVRSLSPSVDATLYRVTEEALTNVRRHATGATRADINLEYRDDGITLSITDDGRAEQPLIPGFGLAGAKSRLAEVGGTLTVANRPGTGVDLRATLPTPTNAPQGVTMTEETT